MAHAGEPNGLIPDPNDLLVVLFHTLGRLVEAHPCKKKSFYEEKLFKQSQC